MRLNNLLLFTGTLFVSLFCRAGVDSNTTSREIINSMLQSIDRIQTLKYTFKSYERFGDETEYSEFDVKMSVNPFRVYMLTKSKRNQGVEVLYIHGQNNNKALVNAGKWLPNLWFSPYSSRMRERQHNTLLQSGFGTLATIVRAAVKRADNERPGEFGRYFRYEGDITWEGRPCYKLVIEDPEFQYVNYTVQEGEDINSIAARKMICGYLILEKNGLKNFDDLKPGMTVKIPTSYAKKTILYIDKATLLPIVQIMFDEKGQFERYEFHNLQINPALSEKEFTPDYEGYGF
ncbi:MAG: hypothetical protein KatS3mg031_0396 [Chitinophagales bacterium]|nr:MAG: hypothetical protein KatS3mg031_0396 [Chitinophagales bacterium]